MFSPLASLLVVVVVMVVKEKTRPGILPPPIPALHPLN
jgi:hypothetical protein